MIKNYKYIIVIAMIAIFLVLVLMSEKYSKEVKSSKKVVTLSTFILFDIAKHIAEDSLELVKIMPSGVDIHAFEPSPKIMAKVEKSNLLIYNGAGLEPWLASFNFKGKAISIANYIKLKHLADTGHDEHGAGCSHSEFDPHFWLDIDNMKKATDIITYEFITLEPKNKLLYLKNRDLYINMLENIHVLYRKKLTVCKGDTIITNHNAFSYLSDKYGFKISSLKGFSPDSSPSPKDMIRILKDINKSGVSVIFFESFSSSKSMRTLAEQANVTIDSLHTLGNITKEDVEMKATYETIMLQNLYKLSKVLECQ